jgi:nitrite reductase/ring-hydroxylating ferredoxin subunit
MDASNPTYRPDRHPATSYDEFLDKDSRPVPAYLREAIVPEIGVLPVDASRYFDKGFLELEAKHVWSRTWQMACREEDIPNINDYHIYEVVGKSLIVVRTGPDEIKAFHNVCLHRSRKLVTLNGCKHEFKCPFHGVTWNSDGTFKENPIAWDFPQWVGKDMSLPQARVDRWGGFVFVNFDTDARPLAEVLGSLVADFERFDFANRYRAVWVQKKVRSNWKVTAEAFMEAHHVLMTHPQIMPMIACANSQYDLINDWVSRQFSANGVPSPFLGPLSEQEAYDRITGGGDPLPEGVSARAHLADKARRTLTETTGGDYSEAADAEMLDSLLYNVFPNMSFWAGYPQNVVYRWRPNGGDPDSSIMDVMILKPCPAGQPRPKPMPVQELGLDEPWSDAAGQMGAAFAAVFEQDMGNLPHVQDGLHASANGLVHFARYSEMRIRHMHQMIDRMIAEGRAREFSV